MRSSLPKGVECRFFQLHSNVSGKGPHVFSQGPDGYSIISLNSLTIRNGEFDGSLTTTGGVGPVSVGSGVSGPLEIGGALKSLTVTGGRLTGSLSAASIGTVTVTGGDMGANLDITGALTSLNVRGGNFLGSLTAGGTVGTISVTSVKNKTTGLTVGGGMTDASINLTGANTKTNVSLTSLSVAGQVTNPDIILKGGAGSIIAAQWDGGSLNAAFASSLNIRGLRGVYAGDLTDAQINLTGTNSKGILSLGSASVAGTVGQSLISISHSATSFKAGTWGAGAILAVSASPGADGKYFTGDAVGAGGTLKSLNIAWYDTDNSGVPFGIIANGYGSITLAGKAVPLSDLPDDYGDCRIWET